MKSIVTLALLLFTLFAPGQVASQVLRETGFVPDDDSVIPQWSATFQKVLEASETDFESFVSATKGQSARLSDSELINGPSAKHYEVPELQSAMWCMVQKKDGVGRLAYQCFFRPSGFSASSAQQDFVRLVRLVEKGVGGTAGLGEPPYASPKMERRWVTIGIPRRDIAVSVTEVWLPKEIDDGLAARNFQLPLRGHLSVDITAGKVSEWKSTNASVGAGVSEIDEVVKSGRYVQMPSAQRVGSSGSGDSSIKVTNDTAYVLSLLYDGVTTKSVTIAAGDTATIALPPGPYKELGHVSAPGILPFVGNEVFGPGDSFVSRFYIGKDLVKK